MMVMGDARFSRKLLKFAKCPYGGLKTSLYGSPGKIIRYVPSCFLDNPSATPPISLVIRQLLHLLLLLLPWCSVVFPWCEQEDLTFCKHGILII